MVGSNAFIGYTIGQAHFNGSPLRAMWPLTKPGATRERATAEAEGNRLLKKQSQRFRNRQVDATIPRYCGAAKVVR
jgi:hypothetical protein